MKDIKQAVKNLGARIAILRRANHLRQEDLAAAAGLSRQTLSDIENGSLSAEIGSYLRILEALGTLEDLESVGRLTAQDVASGAGRRAARVRKPLLAKAVNETKRRRPRDLAEVFAWSRKQGDTDAYLREFLDEFYAAGTKARQSQMLGVEPPLQGERQRDAYVAAVAEHLALRNRLSVPAWTGRPQRFLARPVFPGGLESLKAILLAESPPAFRRRMIFVGADPLYRPRRDAAGGGNSRKIQE
jgi:transcriptional regulator with XRE-family HTH domain